MSRMPLRRIGLALLAVLALAAPAASAQPGRARVNLYLRRATFDPLYSAPQIASAPHAGPAARLLLVQFESVPDATTRQALEAIGLRPLLYIPTNALLVRVTGAQAPALASVPGVRWYGPYQTAYKLPAGLDAALGAQASGARLDLRLLAAPDADVDALARDLAALGGEVKARADGLLGTSLHVGLPSSALQILVGRDDVLWVERYTAPRALNDRARVVLGVTAARQQASWLTGVGQIVAVTDTGLDVQTNLSADFAGRLVQAFPPSQMSTGCANDPAARTWSDRNGHGTHVAGSILGSGALSPNDQFAGMAPEAGLVIQAVSIGGNEFDCFPDDMSFLSKAYDTGARVHNASWGSPTSYIGSIPQYGEYTEFESQIDDYLWLHKDDLFVVAAGNDGRDDSPADGVIDPDSISSPATAKNVLAVGASENDRPPTGSTCASFFSSSPPQNRCWTSWGIAPIADDFISDNANGIAAFSSRGPADDGRIKPEIVAPGTNVISSASHSSSASYPFGQVNSNYAYNNGTSMSAPMISGLAALVRQWLDRSRQIAAPSAALIKGMLVNGAVNLSPGQYGTGSVREIPAVWPNNVEGWGRAALTDTVDLGDGRSLWLVDNQAGFAQTGAAATYRVSVDAGQPLRVSLAWTDYPSFPGAGRALVNDLDLEVQAPDGVILHGNGAAALSADCRDEAGADRCNNVESVAIDRPDAGIYLIRVRAAAIVQGPQPYALIGRAQSIVDRPLDAPKLEPIAADGSPVLALTWSAVAGAASYIVEQSGDKQFGAITNVFHTSSRSLRLVADVGTSWFRVRACIETSCSVPSNAELASVTVPPKKVFLPHILR